MLLAVAQTMSALARRPTYAIMLLALSTLWVCANLFPLLYSLVFPNKDVQLLMYALEGRGLPPAELETRVQKTLAAELPLIRSVPVAYYSGVTAEFKISGSKASKERQASYVAWLQKHPGPLLLHVTCVEEDGGRRVCQADEGGAILTFLVRVYAPSLLLLGVSLLLVFRRKTQSEPTINSVH
jgi:hypothetical protein